MLIMACQRGGGLDREGSRRWQHRSTWARCSTERTKTRVCKKSLDGPPSALAGLTERHNQVLSEIFGIQTVAELGSNKYFALAGALAALANKL